MAALPPPTWGRSLQSHREAVSISSVKLPWLRGLFLTTPTCLPFSQHADLCPPRLKPALPSKAGEHTKTLWCRCADTVPCLPLSCKRDQEASQRSGPVLGEDKLYTHLARAVTGLRASIFPSPAPGVQSHEGLLAAEDTVPPELCGAPTPRSVQESTHTGRVLLGRHNA